MPSTTPTVLLLEDDPDILEAATFALEQEGFRVLSAGDLRSALLLARAAERCTVLLDLSIEGDPYLFVRELRDSAWSGRVLLFSAGDRLEERARALGADGALAKPFDLDSLFEACRPRDAGDEGFTSAS